MGTGIKIGMFGASGSGKTLYLAALNVAAMLHPDGGWTISGRDQMIPGSNSFLNEMTETLYNRLCPPATEDPVRYAYDITGKMNRLVRDRTVNLTMVFDDQPGGDALRYVHAEDEFWKNLASCDGLIFLFDPLKEEEIASSPHYSTILDGFGGDQTPDYTERNFHHVQRVATYLKQAAERQGRLRKGLLPHYLAVCVVKFDLPQVFERLDKAGFVQPTDEDGAEEFSEQPYVAPEDARSAFELLADEETISILARFFDDNRTSYFVTSSVGFYNGRKGPISRRDYANVLLSNPKRIRSAITPVNVFEPFVGLVEQMTRHGH